MFLRSAGCNSGGDDKTPSMDLELYTHHLGQRVEVRAFVFDRTLLKALELQRNAILLAAQRLCTGYRCACRHSFAIRQMKKHVIRSAVLKAHAVEPPLIPSAAAVQSSQTCEHGWAQLVDEFSEHNRATVERIITVSELLLCVCKLLV